MKKQYLQPTIDIERGITGMLMTGEPTSPVIPGDPTSDPTPAPWRY